MTRRRTKGNKAHPGGRPSDYRKEFAEQAKKLCKMGATDQDLADFFNVNVRTIQRWSSRHFEFCRAIKIAKEEADQRVERSLYQRALGYSHPDTHVSNYRGDITLTRLTKHYPPDPTSCIFWLKNRKPKKWRDLQALDVKHTSAETFAKAIEQTPGQTREVVDKLDAASRRRLIKQFKKQGRDAETRGEA